MAHRRVGHRFERRVALPEAGHVALRLVGAREEAATEDEDTDLGLLGSVWCLERGNISIVLFFLFDALDLMLSFV